MLESKCLPNGFEYIEVTNKAATAKIALQGAHLFSYKPHNKKEVLWLSELSDFEAGKAIRGGIPVCWPWFGMNDNITLPQHGFARTSKFTLTGTDESDPYITKIRLTLTQTQESLKLWKFAFGLELHISISNTLTLELKTTNTDTKPFQITQALHTYFNISDISNIAISGLDTKVYLDALTSKYHTQKGSITFQREIDRVYQGVNKEIQLQDINKTITLQNSGSSSVVIWNPWIQKCARMSAMKKDAYKEFVCIETANAFEDFKLLEPKQSHTLRATFVP